MLPRLISKGHQCLAECLARCHQVLPGTNGAVEKHLQNNFASVTYVHVCTHTCMYMCLHTHMHVYVNTHILVHVHTHIHLLVHVLTHTRVHMHTYTFMYMCLYTHMHVHVYKHTHACTCTHTHAFTCANTNCYVTQPVTHRTVVKGSEVFHQHTLQHVRVRGHQHWETANEYPATRTSLPTAEGFGKTHKSSYSWAFTF